MVAELPYAMQYPQLRGIEGCWRAPLTQLEAQRELNAQQRYSHYDLIALANYRVSVHVPAGWADWFACGDQLH